MSITEEWMKKMWQIYAVGFYSAVKENQTVSFAGKSTELEMFMLKKRIQTQKDKHAHFSPMQSLDVNVQIYVPECACVCHETRKGSRE